MRHLHRRYKVFVVSCYFWWDKFASGGGARMLVSLTLSSRDRAGSYSANGASDWFVDQCDGRTAVV